MYMAFSAQAVANEFINIAGKGRLDPMKVQKLVYFAHGWHLAIEDSPLTRQDFEAWQFGPVIPDLYRAFKDYGSGAVTEYATKFNFDRHVYTTPRIREERGEPSIVALDVIRDVWGVYGSYSAIKLSNATHKIGTPWAKWYDPTRHHVVIPNSDIKDYFESMQPKSGAPIGVTANT